MKRSLLALTLSLIALSLILVQCTSTPEKKEEPKKEDTDKKDADSKEKAQKESEEKAKEKKKKKLAWSYEGETGPAFWGVLDPLYSQCSKGDRQSPIDLVWQQPVNGGELKFMYRDTNLKVIDNGHTIQVNFDPGSRAVIRGEEYNLMYLQFRSSSEHTLSGNELPMELQFYHRNESGEIAVVSVFLIEGKHNPTLEKVWNHMPKEKFELKTVSQVNLNPMELIPPRLTYYNYKGSLTVPPCTEGVDWNVLNTPITASGEQILEFRKRYSYNKRPIQDTNDRDVVNY